MKILFHIKMVDKHMEKCYSFMVIKKYKVKQYYFTYYIN